MKISSGHLSAANPSMGIYVNEPTYGPVSSSRLWLLSTSLFSPPAPVPSLQPRLAQVGSFLRALDLLFAPWSACQLPSHLPAFPDSLQAFVYVSPVLTPPREHSLLALLTLVFSEVLAIWYSVYFNYLLCLLPESPSSCITRAVILALV